MDYKFLDDRKLAYLSALCYLSSSHVPAAAYVTLLPFCLNADILITVSGLPFALSLLRALYSWKFPGLPITEVADPK